VLHEQKDRCPDERTNTERRATQRHLEAPLRQGVRVHEVQKPLDHARLHVLDPNAPRGALLHGAEELRPKHPGPRGEHVPVGEEEPVADADRHVGGLQHARGVGPTAERLPRSPRLRYDASRWLRRTGL